MSLRTSLQNLIRRGPAASLRERAAEASARLAASKLATGAPEGQAVEPAATLEDAAQLDFTAYNLPDPIKTPHQWAARFSDFAMGMHVADRILRMSKTEAMAFIQDAGERDANLAGNMFQALNSAQTTFEGWGKLLEVASSRYFVAGSATVLAGEAQGAQREETPEPATNPMATEPSAEADAMLLALASEWEAARDAYDEVSNRQLEITAAANADNQPGPAPEYAGSEWQRWFQRSKEWRERTGIDAAEEASAAACRAVGEVENRIAALPAGSLAGLRLKARVAKHNQDIGVDWPEGLGEGLARDILAITEAQVRRPAPHEFSLIDMLDLASATMKELWDIQDMAEHVGAAAYAYTWGARCRRSENHYGAPEYNDLGKLMVWLGDALTNVESAVDKEAARRMPDGSADRETRLMLRARPIIDNGDADGIEAFANELLAHVEAERRSR